MPDCRDLVNPEGFKRNSPLLFYFVRLFSIISHYLDFYDRDHKKRSINGIKIRDNEIWTMKSSGSPNEVMGYITGKCGIKCEFCYLKGNPPRMNSLNKGIKDQEVIYRLSLFERGRTFIQRDILSTDEQTTHPLFLYALERIRKTSTYPVYVETNAVHLTGDIIRSISRLGGIYLNVSVNVLKPGLRRRLLKDRDPSRIIKNLRLLSEAGMSFSVSMVPWHTVPFDEIGETALTCSELGANLLRFRLPGYTSFYSSKALFDLDEYWSKIIDYAGYLRKSTGLPIITEPSKYEQLRDDRVWRYPFVLAVIKGSPAHREGIRYGDHIIRINEKPMIWRNEGIKQLILHHAGKRSVKLRILRQGVVSEMSLEFKSGSFPYDCLDLRCPYGLYLSDDIDYSSIIRLRNIIAEEKPEKAVFISSKLMEKSVRTMLSISNIEDLLDILEIHVPPNSFFGGNVFMGDLLVVSDIIGYLKGLREKNVFFDMVLIPSSLFNEWGNDITGRCFKEVEYVLNTRVFLIPSHLISL